MLIELSKWEIKRLRQALYLAIDYEDSSIDAHTVELYKPRKGDLKSIVPKEFRSVVAFYKRNIKAFEKLLKKLRYYETN